jgi:hypothetical protein
MREFNRSVSLRLAQRCKMIAEYDAPVVPRRPPSSGSGRSDPHCSNLFSQP